MNGLIAQMIERMQLNDAAAFVPVELIIDLRRGSNATPFHLDMQPHDNSESASTSAASRRAHAHSTGGY